MRSADRQRQAVAETSQAVLSQLEAVTGIPLSQQAQTDMSSYSPAMAGTFFSPSTLQNASNAVLGSVPSGGVSLTGAIPSLFNRIAGLGESSPAAQPRVPAMSLANVAATHQKELQEFEDWKKSRKRSRSRSRSRRRHKDRTPSPRNRHSRPSSSGGGPSPGSAPLLPVASSRALTMCISSPKAEGGAPAAAATWPYEAPVYDAVQKLLKQERVDVTTVAKDHKSLLSIWARAVGEDVIDVAVTRVGIIAPEKSKSGRIAQIFDHLCT